MSRKDIDPAYKYASYASMDPNDPFKITGPHTIETNPALVCVKEKQLFRSDPVGLVKGGYLKIKTKDGELKTLDPNSTQKKVIEAVQSQRRLGLPVRVCILKARQLGTSTACEGILFAMSTQRPFANSMVLADDEDGAKYIYQMNETFYDELGRQFPHLVPHKKRASEQRMEFHGTKSSIMIDTANNKKAGRKFTLRNLHMSECAFYRDFKGTFQSAMQSVPNLPETVVLLETTANGTGEFCKFWRRIKKAHNEGRSGWIPLFLSWKEHDEYRMKFYSDKAMNLFEESLSREERAIVKKYGLSLEQMNWRRWKIENDFAGDTDKFEVEFPLDDEQAFKSTAKSVFPEKILNPQFQNLIPAKSVGEIELSKNKPYFMPMKEGMLKVWDGPKAGRTYVIGADSCESAVAEDEACAQVLDRKTWTVVAHLHGHIPPTQFAESLFALGLWYNCALLCPEMNGPGLVTVSKLSELYYPNICRRQKLVVTDGGQMVETEEVGFHTNVKTKPNIIAASQDAFRNLLIVIHDEVTYEQHRTYVVVSIKEGHVVYGADEGYHDDCVMALAIAVYHAKQLPDPKDSDVEEHYVIERSGRITGY